MDEKDEKVNAETVNSLQIKCESCGGVMRYSPEKQNLKCIYCGAEKELDNTPIQVEAFRYDKCCGPDSDQTSTSEQMQEVQEVKCHQCGAVTTLPENVSSMKCPFCGTSLVVNEQQINRSWKPGAMLPFKLEEKKGKESYRNWLSGKWFAPSELRKKVADTTAFRGVYLPFWAYDTETKTIYVGQRGTTYKKVVERNGKRETETEIRWAPAAGEVDWNFFNILVSATATLPDSISSELTDWDLENSVAYKEEYVSGFVTELYTKDFVDCKDKAQTIMESKIEELVKKDIGGDRQRIITKDITYDNVMFKLFLLPVWMSSFTYKNKIYQFVVNGRTGQVTGNYPLSTLKVILAVVGVILLIVLFYLLFS